MFVPMRLFPRISKPVFSWAMYDWANSAFATTVMAGFFPIFFKKYWSSHASATESTFYLGIANSTASLAIVLVAPMLGAIADFGRSSKKYLFAFASLGIMMTAGLFFIGKGQWEMAVLAYVLASFGFSGSGIFYDSLLKTLSNDEHELDKISALGFALGYLGGGILFAINVFMTLKPELFGLADAGIAVRISFILVAIWWAIFSIPLFLNVPEEGEKTSAKLGESILGGLRELSETFHMLRKLKQTFYFLIGYWLYIDGVDTIVRMAVDYGMSLGFDSNSLILALLITQFVGFPSAIVFGRVGVRFGPKIGILVAIGVYILVTFWGYFMQSPWEFYMLAVVIGLVQGGIQSLSRSLYARLIPPGRNAQFFGFYNMMGKFAAVIGPAMMGYVALVLGSTRASILSLNILFVLGAILLWKVDVKAGQKASQAHGK